MGPVVRRWRTYTPASGQPHLRFEGYSCLKDLKYRQRHGIPHFGIRTQRIGIAHSFCIPHIRGITYILFIPQHYGLITYVAGHKKFRNCSFESIASLRHIAELFRSDRRKPQLIGGLQAFHRQEQLQFGVLIRQRTGIVHRQP